MTFIINTNGAPLARHGAVVYQGDKRRCNKFTNAVCIHTGTTRNKVCFQTVPTCFVKQHTTRTTFDNNWHSATWRWARTKFAYCLASCALCQLGNAFFFKQFKTNGVTKRVITRLHATVAVGHCAHSENCANLFISCKYAIRVCNQNASRAVAVAGAHLHNASVDSACNIIRNAEQFNLACLRNCLRRNAYVVYLLALDGAKRHRVGVAIACACGGCGCFGCCHQACFAEVGCVGKPSGLAIDDANTGA